MAPLPKSVLTFTNKEGLDRWYADFKAANPRLTFSTTCTNSESLCRQVERADLSPPGSDKGEKDSDIAKKLHARFSSCAPFYECAWVSCNGMVERSLKWFEANKDQAFMDWHRKYGVLRTKVPTADEVDNYQIAALKWRAETQFQVNSLTMATDEPVVKVYRVGHSIVTDLKDLLEDMKKRRNAALGLQEGVERAPSEHVDHFSSWIKAGDWTVPCPWGDWDKKNKNGYPLSTTAAAGIINKRLMKKEELEKSLKAMVDSIREAKNNNDYDANALKRLDDTLSSIYTAATTFLTGQKTQSAGGFVQQGSALDTAFSSHYWAWSSGVKLETFPSLSAMLYALGKSPMGKRKVEKRLKDCPFAWAQKLCDMFSTIKDDAIHMHPAVLTPSRMSTDMVCSFGAFPVSDPSKISDGASSPRFILNLRSDGDNAAGKAISFTFREYKIAYPDWKAELIVPVEHMLHQTFLSKSGPFVNVSQVPGQALNVNIVPIEE
ncbi:nucleocapsid protein [Pangolin orthonairovirus]|uniref:Nucleoprotein n=1 Tax=Pangolin orthonairovirus TaxID=2951875 RepID=A0AAE9LG62_9VIRU|nr:nucleocapsid protein [Pangolin orthonairovirus]